jgi:phenylacetate-coenzyme A ligase PaaK-like adenylate-forming protein
LSSTITAFHTSFKKRLFTGSACSFNDLCVELFQFQYGNNTAYRTYCDLINTTPEEIREYTEIPFLPISAFKSHELKCGSFKPEAIFTSSGTMGLQTSRHFVKDLKLYERSFHLGFDHFYDEVEEYCVLGLLPSYLEREGSSLIYMVNDFIKKSNHPKSGFFLNNQQDLYEILVELVNKNTKVLLIGVSFALLDFAEKYQIESNENLIVMETGGMKGRRKELIREELHAKLSRSFRVKYIHSEYGMTELLSQAYSKGNGIFETPPWMKVLIREQDDPFQLVQNGQAGAINIIDLANISSCAFIRTDDLGTQVFENKFKVLGRLDVSDLRGCNLMVN